MRNNEPASTFALNYRVTRGCRFGAIFGIRDSIPGTDGAGSDSCASSVLSFGASPWTRTDFIGKNSERLPKYDNQNSSFRPCSIQAFILHPLLSESWETKRNPILLLKLSGAFLLRFAQRTFLRLLFQEPPRSIWPQHRTSRRFESANKLRRKNLRDGCFMPAESSSNRRAIFQSRSLSARHVHID